MPTTSSTRQYALVQRLQNKLQKLYPSSKKLPPGFVRVNRGIHAGITTLRPQDTRGNLLPPVGWPYPKEDWPYAPIGDVVFLGAGCWQFFVSGWITPSNIVIKRAGRISMNCAFTVYALRYGSPIFEYVSSVCPEVLNEEDLLKNLQIPNTNPVEEF